MHYLVHTVAAHELPEGVDHLIVERDNGEPSVLLIAGVPARVWEFMRAWEDEWEPSEVPTVLVPRQRADEAQHARSA